MCVCKCKYAHSSTYAAIPKSILVCGKMAEAQHVLVAIPVLPPYPCTDISILQ